MATKTVRQNMGLVQLIFVEVDAPCKQYHFTHSDKWNKMHTKWSPHKQYFRGRRCAALLTHEIPAKSKSGSSYEIIGVLAIFESHDELSYANTEYWNHIQFKNSDEDKLMATMAYADFLKEKFVEIGRENSMYESTYNALKAIAAGVTDEKLAEVISSSLKF